MNDQGAQQRYSFSREWDDNHESPETRDLVFNRKSLQDGKHVSPYDNGRVLIGIDGIQVRLIKGINEEQFKNVVSMALRATTGVDLTAAYDDQQGDTDEMFKGGLQQALEAETISFAVSGVSRACTHQLVRTRKASFNQQSQRATFYGEQPEVRMPESIWRNPRAREAALEAIGAAHRAYAIAAEEDISYQDARYMLSEGTTNFIVCTYSVREFVNTFSYRACYLFQHEISAVFRRMRELVLEQHPWMEPHIKISCERSGKCHFQGWEKVQEQCSLPMARENNRIFKSAKYSIESTEPDHYDVLKELTLSIGGVYASWVLRAEVISVKGEKFNEQYFRESLGKAAHEGWLRADTTNTDSWVVAG